MALKQGNQHIYDDIWSEISCSGKKVGNEKEEHMTNKNAATHLVKPSSQEVQLLAKQIGELRQKYNSLPQESPEKMKTFTALENLIFGA